MQRIHRQNSSQFLFDARAEPLLRVRPGESFAVETMDAGNGYFRSTQDKAIPANRPGFDRHPPESNPIAGPIWLEGAQPGDTLVVSVEQIDVADSSWTAIGPGRGPLGDSIKWSDLAKEYTTKIFEHLPGESGTLRDGHVRFNDRLRWPITPFIGTIGVAPDREVATSIDGQGIWGGNLDIRDAAPGNKILLPVFHDGALLFLGDVHASQGDGEFTGTAAETKATVTLSLNLAKETRYSSVRIIKPEAIAAVVSARPMESAVRSATICLMEWLVGEYGFSQVDAYCFVGTCPDFRINVYQMCDIGKLSFVVGAELPKCYL